MKVSSRCFTGWTCLSIETLFVSNSNISWINQSAALCVWMIYYWNFAGMSQRPSVFPLPPSMHRPDPHRTAHISTEYKIIHWDSVFLHLLYRNMSESTSLLASVNTETPILPVMFSIPLWYTWIYKWLVLGTSSALQHDWSCHQPMYCAWRGTWCTFQEPPPGELAHWLLRLNYSGWTCLLKGTVVEHW